MYLKKTIIEILVISDGVIIQTRALDLLQLRERK